MSYSLNEVEVLARKAARGAGYSWGMASNAGRATRWLCWHGLDGCGALAVLLGTIEQLDRLGPQQVEPQLWQSGTGQACPLVVGTGMLDRVDVLSEGRATIKNVRLPILVLPFVAATALRLRTTATLEWDDFRIVSDGRQASLEGDMNALNAELAEEIATWRGGVIGEVLTNSWRANPDPSDWQVLEAFAAHTYAPATEESRQKGAGFSHSDDD